MRWPKCYRWCIAPPQIAKEDRVGRTSFNTLRGVATVMIEDTAWLGLPGTVR
jgi:hypothetical protein